ncbi:hypothetical protein [Streptomyces maremycinicus]|uniref:hypothetical protein n=1 Tax=Streptomyces maremycinicus TaxID=1679753 RepID=UPI00078750AF|nr:hypothetical protein [Streptomyces sp. NBRC 110468]
MTAHAAPGSSVRDRFDVPEVVTGGIGVALIPASLPPSLTRSRREQEDRSVSIPGSGAQRTAEEEPVTR